MRYQRGPQRSGSQAWRTNDFDAAIRKAQRIVEGTDVDNRIKPSGWVTVDENFENGYRAVRVFRAAEEEETSSKTD